LAAPLGLIPTPQLTPPFLVSSQMAAPRLVNPFGTDEESFQLLPQAGGFSGRTIVLDEEFSSETNLNEPPPASLQPLPIEPPSPIPDDLKYPDLPTAGVRRVTPAPDPPESAGSAWDWSSSLATRGIESTPPPALSPGPPPQSAWDSRSDPGLSVPPAADSDRAIELISSGSKISERPETAERPALTHASDEVAALLRGARDLVELDDHTGAMELILKALQNAPDDVDVLAMRDKSERTLLTMFESKLGGLERTPKVLLKDDEIIWLNLDHRAGFVLAQIDGTVTFDDLFAVSGMSRFDTARILAQLVDEGVISAD
jgi:hypothetical protein